MEAYKYALLGSGTFSVAPCVWSAVFTLLIVVFGILLFNKVERNFMDIV